MRCEAWNRVRGQLVHCGREGETTCIACGRSHCARHIDVRAHRPICSKCNRKLVGLLAHSRPADDRHKGDTP